MQYIKKLFVAALFILAGTYYSNAKELQPRILVSEPVLYDADYYTGTDTVPVKTFMKIKPVTTASGLQQAQQVKTVQPEQKAQTVKISPAVSTVAVAEKKDTALFNKIIETFKFKKTTTTTERIKIKLLIDSVYKDAKENPKTAGGDSTLDYLTLVHIIDSLLKANKRDSEKVIVDTAFVKKADSSLVDTPENTNGPGQGMKMYWWLIVAIGLILAGLAFFIVKRKRRIAAQSKIFFSYAWDQDEALIMQLYNSLKNDGFNVIKDKENIGYKGVISKFMNDIGSADFVVVAISDKYLRSKFCMYELYELFRNSGMNSDAFGKKIFPIRIEESLNLSEPDVVNGYIRYWKEQEQEWTKRVKEESESITEEQARQYQFVKRLVIDIRNILSCLADINSLDLHTLQSNNFADVKSALRNSIDMAGQA